MTDTVILSKTALKEQADIILADNPGMSRDDAYGRALVRIIMGAKVDVSEIEQHDFDDAEWYRRVKNAEQEIQADRPEMSRARAHAIAAMIVSDGFYSKWRNADEIAARAEWASRIVAPEEPITPSIVYLIQGVSGGPIKIGLTTDLDARLKALTYHEPLRVLATVPGVRADEMALHKRFAHCRVHGEWFEPTDDLMEFIENARSDRS